MNKPVFGGILRRDERFANSTTAVLALLVLCALAAGPAPAIAQTAVVDPNTEITSFMWDFSRTDDPKFKKFPDQWRRVRDIGFPKYVIGEITACDTEFEKR